MDEEKIKKEVKDYNKKFLKQLLIGFLVVAIMTFCFGYFDFISRTINFKFPEKTFEIIVTIIGFLGILLGFLLTALGIIVSGVQTRFHSETKEKQKIKLNEYWLYIIKVSKSVMFLLLGYILTFIICLLMIETVENLNGEIYLLVWVVLSTLLVCYIVFDRIFDYYENPFEK